MATRWTPALFGVVPPGAGRRRPSEIVRIVVAALVVMVTALGAESLPLLQIIVINSFASFVGGMAPVPGGMGVVEAGLIAGLTAAGIPETEAVATTFTYRTFTAYLRPIWGWFALQPLRKHEYVSRWLPSDAGPAGRRRCPERVWRGAPGAPWWSRSWPLGPRWCR